MDNYRGDTQPFYGGFSLGQTFAGAAILGGLTIFYTQSRRNLVEDLTYLTRLPINRKEQQRLLLVFQKGWYNQRVSWKIKVEKGPGRRLLSLKRKLNVKSTPANLK